jgi:hypothetical protein
MIALLHSRGTDMPVSDLPGIDGCKWGRLRSVDGLTFPSVGTELATIILSTQQSALQSIEDSKNSFVASVPATPPGPFTQKQLQDTISGAFSEAKRIVERSLNSLADAAKILDAEFDVVYMARGACPINSNPDSHIDLIDDEFDPPLLPSFNLPLEIKVSIPEVLELTIPFPIRWIHSWEFTSERALTTIEVGSGLGGHTADHIVKRAQTTYFYTLHYSADVALGPAAFPPGTLDGHWKAQQVVTSEWCND